MKKVRFAVIGTNMITERFLLAAEQCEEFVLTAIYSRTIGRAEEFARQYPVKYIFDDLDKLAACPEVDAVYIASPTAFHAKQTLLMLRNRKHVLCEKPVTANSTELELLLRIAEEKKVVLLEAIRSVFTPGYPIIKDQLKNIGKIRRATFVYCQYSSRYDQFKAGETANAFRPELANGALMDIGVYGVHLLASLFGVPYSVVAKGHIIPGSIDGAGVLIGKYKDMQAEIIYSKITDSFLPSEIQGEEGNIVFSPVSAPEKIRVVKRNGAKETFYTELVKPDMYYEIKAFLNMVLKDRKTAYPYNEISLTTMRILDDARKQMDIVFPNDF